MSVQHYKNGQLSLIAGAGGFGGGNGGECDCENKTFTGTTAEVEQAIADGIIKDDYIVNITDDVAEENEILNSYEEIMANTEIDKYAGATGVKEGFAELNSKVTNLGWTNGDLNDVVFNTKEISIINYAGTAINAPTREAGMLTTERSTENTYMQTAKVFAGGIYVRTIAVAEDGTITTDGWYKSSLQWKLAIADTTDSYTVTQDYTELLVYCSNKATSINTSPCANFIFQKGIDQRCRAGYYGASNNYGFADITKTGDTLAPLFYINGASGDRFMTVYYR